MTQSEQLFIHRTGTDSKPALVMLHGWGMNSGVWQPVLNQLEPHFSITLIDLPGLGKSPALQNLSFDNMLGALLDAAPEQAHWLGWSLGGQLALAVAKKAPERVQSLVMVASNPCFVAREDWSCAMELETYSGFKTALAENPAKTLTRFAMLQTQGAEAGRETLKHLKHLLKSSEPQDLPGTLSLLETDTRDALRNLTQPALLQFGDKDLLVPVSAAKACAELNADVQITEYAGAGHLPFVSHGEQWSRDLIAFLDGVSR